MMKKNLSLTLNYKKLVINTIQKKYLSLLLGIIIFSFITFLSLNYSIAWLVSQTRIFQTKITKRDKISSYKSNPIQNEVKRYQVKEGENLWQIAEKTYGSGFNAYDVAAANKINNPNLLYSGQNLILPKISPKVPTQGEISSTMTDKVKKTVNQYTVQQGDTLCLIAEKFYGDCEAWVTIANANNLINPDRIEIGTVLTIPR